MSVSQVNQKTTKMETVNTPTLLPTIEIPVDSITIDDRSRQDFGDIEGLAESIRDVGLIQPIVVDQNHKLIAGERRLRAHKLLKFTTIKVVYLEVLDEAQRTVLEATENIVRKEFTWQERILALDKVHRLKVTERALVGESWGYRETAALLRTKSGSKSMLQRLIALAPYIRAGDPDVLAAESVEDAYRVFVRRREDEFSKELVSASRPKSSIPSADGKTKIESKDISDETFFSLVGSTGFTPGITSPIDLDERPGSETHPTTGVDVPLSRMFFHVDAVEKCKTFDAGTFDAVITDWPYGIEMGNIQQDGGGKDVESTAVEHDVDSNEKLHAAIIPEVFRILKPNGWFITWTDLSQWQRNYDICIAAGFKVQRWPLVWHKTSACQNMAAQYNFTKNFEVAIVCRKGNATLLRPQASSVWSGGNDAETRLLGHPFAKPAALWEWVLNATCLRGAVILDPFVGSGSSVMPMIRMGLRPVGIESNETHFHTLNVNLQNFYRSLDPKCTFS